MRLSYSACCQLQSCQKQFYLQRIAKVAKDSDVTDDATALTYGKCYHRVLELTRHSQANFTMPLFDSVIKEHFPEVVSDGFLTVTGDNKELQYGVYACLQSYYELHAKRKLELVGVEVEIGTENEMLGYVDAVLQDSYGFWWVLDLKTSGLVQEPLFARLHTDPQLNLYAAYAWQLCNKLDLDPEKFAGCRYCVVVKPRIAIKNDTIEAYAARVKPKIFDVEIPAFKLNPQVVMQHYKELNVVADSITTDNALRNYSACLTYNRPCDYWSHCHGNIYTNCVQEASAFTCDNIIDRTTTPSMEQCL